MSDLSSLLEYSYPEPDRNLSQWMRDMLYGNPHNVDYYAVGGSVAGGGAAAQAARSSGGRFTRLADGASGRIPLRGPDGRIRAGYQHVDNYNRAGLSPRALNGNSSSLYHRIMNRPPGTAIEPYRGAARMNATDVIGPNWRVTRPIPSTPNPHALVPFTGNSGLLGRPLGPHPYGQARGGPLNPLFRPGSSLNSTLLNGSQPARLALPARATVTTSSTSPTVASQALRGTSSTSASAAATAQRQGILGRMGSALSASRAGRAGLLASRAGLGGPLGVGMTVGLGGWELYKYLNNRHGGNSASKAVRGPHTKNKLTPPPSEDPTGGSTVSGSAQLRGLPQIASRPPAAPDYNTDFLDQVMANHAAGPRYVTLPAPNIPQRTQSSTERILGDISRQLTTRLDELESVTRGRLAQIDSMFDLAESQHERDMLNHAKEDLVAQAAAARAGIQASHESAAESISSSQERLAQSGTDTAEHIGDIYDNAIATMNDIRGESVDNVTQDDLLARALGVAGMTVGGDAQAAQEQTVADGASQATHAAREGQINSDVMEWMSAAAATENQARQGALQNATAQQQAQLISDHNRRVAARVREDAMTRNQMAMQERDRAEQMRHVLTNQIHETSMAHAQEYDRYDRALDDFMWRRAEQEATLHAQQTMAHDQRHDDFLWSMAQHEAMQPYMHQQREQDHLWGIAEREQDYLWRNAQEESAMARDREFLRELDMEDAAKGPTLNPHFAELNNIRPPSGVTAYAPGYGFVGEEDLEELQLQGIPTTVPNAVFGSINTAIQRAWQESGGNPAQFADVYMALMSEVLQAGLTQDVVDLYIQQHGIDITNPDSVIRAFYG